MLLKHARHKVGEAMGSVGSPVLGGRGIGWPALKRLGIIAIATVVLVLLVSSLDGPRRGAGPLLLVALGLLIAILDFHRHDRRVFGLLLGVLPLSMLAAWAASDTPMTSGATDQATALGNEASMSGVAQFTEFLGWVGGQVPGATNWLLAEGQQLLAGLFS